MSATKWKGPAWIRDSTLAPAEVARAFAVSFLMLGSYYLVRPVRDDIGAIHSQRLDQLFLGTFVSMVALSPLHGALVARIPRRAVVPAVYWISAAVLVAFQAALGAGVGGARLEMALYVFLAVYNLFVVSSFWSWMNDRFPEVEARRWFGPVAVGGTVGSLLASRVVADLGETFGNGLLSLSAGVLALAGLLVALDRGSFAHAAGRAEAVGGGAYAGAKHVFSDPYLAGIAAYVFLLTVGGTVLYTAQSDIFRETFGDDRDLRRTWLGNMDFASNLGTLAFQLGVVGPWMLSRRVTPVLAALPIFAVIAFPTLALAPTLWTIVVLQVLTRVGKYGLAKPSRESMYTVVSPEDRFKAKTFLDTVVYRGGDWITSVASVRVLSAFGSLSAVAWAFAPLAAAWTALAVWLGRTQSRRADAARDTEPDA